MRTLRTPIGLVAVLVLLVACRSETDESPTEPTVDRAHVVLDDAGKPTDDPRYTGTDGKGFPWMEKGPVAWLVHLQAGYEASRSDLEGANGGNISAVQPVWGRHVGWVQDRDLPALVARLSDDTPCLHVRMARSSSLPFGGIGVSTVGREAAFLLLAWRSEHESGVAGVAYEGYPPSLASTDLTNETIEGLRGWWTRRTSTGVSARPDGDQVPPATLRTLEYRAVPSRTFWSQGTEIRGVTLEDLASALRRHRRDDPDARFEIKSEVKVTPHEEERIRVAFRDAGAPLTHFWVPVSEPVDEAQPSPHGPGYVDLGP